MQIQHGVMHISYIVRQFDGSQGFAGWGLGDCVGGVGGGVWRGGDLSTGLGLMSNRAILGT